MILGKGLSAMASVLAGSAMLFTLGCSDKARPDAASTTYVTSSEVLVRGDVSGASSDPRGEYARIARADLDNLDQRVVLLGVQAKNAGPERRARAENDLREVRAKLRDLRIRVDAVPAMQTALWEKEQPHLQTDWDALGDRVDRLGASLSDRP